MIPEPDSVYTYAVENLSSQPSSRRTGSTAPPKDRYTGSSATMEPGVWSMSIHESRISGTHAARP